MFTMIFMYMIFYVQRFAPEISSIFKISFCFFLQRR